MNCCFEKNVREIFIDLIAKEDDERVFLDRRTFSYSADDLHGNKLTPWRSARKKKIKKIKKKEPLLIYPRTFAKYWTCARPEGPSRRKSRS